MRIACCSVVIFVHLIFIPVASSNQWKTAAKYGLDYNLMREENHRIHDTELFLLQPGLHVRHGLNIHLKLHPCKDCDDNCDKPFEFKLIDSKQSTPLTWKKPRPTPNNGELRFDLHIYPSIPVGHAYALNVNDPCSKKFHSVHVRLSEINVMFNPQRSKLDTLSKYEYLRNNYGYIWTGTSAIPWKYDVGSAVVTRSIHRVTDLMTHQERTNAVLFSRALTRIINEHVLVGRWKPPYNDFPDSVEPTRWVGSEQILQRWLQSGRKVRYGQCWVFAGLLTTLLRVSGIPARTVTNYDSHHDRGITDDRKGILRFFDNIVQPDESTWNFHVWSEAWLERPDLSAGEVDWNAVDATPQEPSPLELLAPGKPNLIYRTGPAYVPYIQANHSDKDYDTLFVLAEVNAVGKCSNTQNRRVGTRVVTKKPGGIKEAAYNFNNPEVITNNYKLTTALEQVSDRDVFPRASSECELPGGMRIKSSPTRPRVGEDFTIEVTEGSVPVKDTVIRMELWSYNGESLKTIHEYRGDWQINLKEPNYQLYLSESNRFRFTVGVYESGAFLPHDTLRLTLEYNQVKVDAKKVGKTITTTLTYTNPLSIPMTGVVINVAGPNYVYLRIELPDIPANGLFKHTVSVECGTNTDNDVMVPVSLDSEETLSAYGSGWSSCSEDLTAAWKYLMSLLRTVN